ncbi:helix-turn-helix transcriptional regulator [Actinocorallia aurantiaca]|uniref:Helix-turn-helix transcriptional regulator n=1 Tax=Actinocorallia aurantiaca TaxID=46204 RepID=A0ABN3U7L9_9ACTN
MSVAESLDPRSSIHTWISVYLREQRLKRGLSYAQTALIMKCGRSTVSNIEAARLKLTMDQAVRLDRAWDLGQQLQIMLHFARTSHDPEWWRSYTEYEAQAEIIKLFKCTAVPGLLQTRDYAHALLVAGRAHDPGAAAEKRVARQAILHEEQPPDVFVLLAESVFDCHVGGAETMRKQLTHLLEMDRLLHVTIRLVPRGTEAHVGLDGSFNIVSTPTGTIGYVEAVNGGRLMTDPGEVRDLGIRYDRISALAFPRSTTLEFLQRTMESFQ